MLLARFRHLYRFLERRMESAQPGADGRTHLLSAHGATRVDAVAEQRIAQASLRVLVFDYELVEVQSHQPVPLFAQDILRTDSITKRHAAKRRNEDPGAGSTSGAPCGEAPRHPDARASTRVGRCLHCDMPRTGDIALVRGTTATRRRRMEEWKADAR